MRTTKSCASCGAKFVCGGSSGTCWCADYPAIIPPDFSRDCSCPECLAKAIAQFIEDRITILPHDEALRMATAEPRSPRLIGHVDYTLENGNYVFSKWFLLKQRKCCGNGCRNCPYPLGRETVSQ